MTRLRTILGLIAGVLFILSSAAHSIVGWLGIRTRIEQLHPPVELFFGLKVVWMFSGMAMLAFGIIVVALFVQRFRGKEASTFPGKIISVGYLGIGVWVMSASHFDPFFLLFIVPGALLAIASW